MDGIYPLTVTLTKKEYSYEYDNIGQLVRENNLPANKTYVYVYDYAGNRTEKRTYSYTTGTPTGRPSIDYYYYTDSNWGDLLTAYQGGSNAITYDAIGNPINIYGTTLTWQGRRLTSYTIGSNVYSYTYNADGIRTSKTVNGVTHNYVLEGSTILAETYGNTTLRFVYDNTGVIGLYYNGTLYMYEKNLQGDVVAILDSNLTRVVEYAYDAWGNVLNVSGSLASTLGSANPIRYRSYYYDTETGWYYLQSRYYNPVWGRFINADNYVNANGDLIGFNMFAYCSNNPVMFVDYTGSCKKFLWWKIDCNKATCSTSDNYNPDCDKVAVLYDGRTSGWMFGLLFGKGFNKQGKALIKRLETRYDVEDYSFKTLDEFVEAWESLSGEYSEIYIMSHGYSGCLSCAGKSISGGGDSDYHFYELSCVSAEMVYLYSCNGATYSEYGSAAEWFSLLTGGTVRAVENGSLNYNIRTYKPYPKKPGRWVDVYVD